MSNEESAEGYVVFNLSGQQHAVPVAAVDRIIRVVEVSPIPQAHPLLLGVIDVQGHVVPVVNTRKILGLPEGQVELSDQLILIKASHGSAALWVEQGSDFIKHTLNETSASEEIPSHLSSAKAAVRHGGGLVFLHDVEKLTGFLGTQIPSLPAAS